MLQWGRTDESINKYTSVIIVVNLFVYLFIYTCVSVRNALPMVPLSQVKVSYLDLTIIPANGTSATEKLLHILHDLPALPGINFSHVNNQIINKAFSLFYDRKFRKVFSPIFAKADLRLLRNLGKDKNIVVCRPD